MTTPKIALVLLVAALIALASPASAETLTQSNVDARLVVALRVSPAALQAALPAPWQVSPIPSGPSKDANALLVFIDQKLVQDAEGKPLGAGTNRVVVLAVPGRNPQTGASGPVVTTGFSADPAAAPGAYKVYVPAQISHEKTLRLATADPGTAEESWNVADGPARLSLRVQYRRAVPARSRVETKVYSAIEPSFFRIYRVDQGADVVRSGPAGVDRVQAYELKSGLPQLAKLLDGSEQLISITVIPWYVRQVFLP